MDQDKEMSSGKEINIDINGEPTSSSVKNMKSYDESRVGLTREELMKCANEPFWVVLRNTLFGAFWVIWAAIIILAIAFVVNAPNCKLVSAAAVNATQNATTPSSSG